MCGSRKRDVDANHTNEYVCMHAFTSSLYMACAQCTKCWLNSYSSTQTHSSHTYRSWDFIYCDLWLQLNKTWRSYFLFDTRLSNMCIYLQFFIPSVWHCLHLSLPSVPMLWSTIFSFTLTPRSTTHFLRVFGCLSSPYCVYKEDICVELWFSTWCSIAGANGKISASNRARKSCFTLYYR